MYNRWSVTCYKHQLENCLFWQATWQYTSNSLTPICIIALVHVSVFEIGLLYMSCVVEWNLNNLLIWVWPFHCWGACIMVWRPLNINHCHLVQGMLALLVHDKLLINPGDRGYWTTILLPPKCFSLPRLMNAHQHLNCNSNLTKYY